MTDAPEKGAAAPPPCPICQCPIGEGEADTRCPACDTRYHAECWTENGGCAVYGCAQVPPTEKLSELEIPPAYWGQENKPCPACGAEILAAALRCRHCGTVFASAKPETASDLAKRQADQQSIPAAKKWAVCLFLANIFLCTAPVAAVVGIIWYRRNREILRKMPSAWQAVSLIGIGMGILMTVLFILMTLFYANFRAASS